MYNKIKEDNLFRLFIVETSPISLNLDHGLVIRIMMLLNDKNAENFPKDPASTFLNRLQQDSESRSNRCYFEEISIKISEVHASLYKVQLFCWLKYFFENTFFGLIFIKL